MDWKNASVPLPPLDVYVTAGNYHSVKAAQPILAGEVITEFGGDTELTTTLIAMGIKPKWFLAVEGYHHTFVMNGARGGRWPFYCYLDEKKLGSFVNSSRTVSSIHSAAGANAVIKWEFNANPRLMRAVLVARVGIAQGEEILWDYPWA